GHVVHDFVVAAPVDVYPQRVPKSWDGRFELFAALCSSFGIALGRPGRDYADLIGLRALRENTDEPGIVPSREVYRQFEPFGSSGAGIEMNENIAQRHGFLALGLAGVSGIVMGVRPAVHLSLA